MAGYISATEKSLGIEFVISYYSNQRMEGDESSARISADEIGDIPILKYISMIGNFARKNLKAVLSGKIV